VLTQGEPSMPTLLEALAGVGVVVSPTEYERHVKQQRIHVTLHAQVPVAGSERMASLLESQPGLERVRVEPIS
jgi:hypothetical protein